jgi:hypothetical protein
MNSNEREKKRRDSLSDSMVKKTIYIQGKGNIRYSDITPEMIEVKRAAIMAHRKHRVEGSGPSCKVYFPTCKVCGCVFTARQSTALTCSPECRQEKARRYSLRRDSAKKQLKERLCTECGKPFVSEYGNKRRAFCSTLCACRHDLHDRHDRQRARKYGVVYQYINPKKVFKRDGYRCQICGKATPMSRRGTCYPNAPELDHRIPISKGGGHVYDNVQCACRSCNGKKSNHSEAGQVSLFTIETTTYRGRLRSLGI